MGTGTFLNSSQNRNKTQISCIYPEDIHTLHGHQYVEMEPISCHVFGVDEFSTRDTR